MTRELNLDDIQGNVIRAYGRFNFPCARYFFLNIKNAAAGRKFIDEVRGEITTGTRWNKENPRPEVTMNIALTFMGMLTLELPTRTLKNFPQEYIDGMKQRAHILGDSDSASISVGSNSWCKSWDPIWQDNRAGKGDDVHIWISMNSQVEKGTS
jgi:hypothetical protein